MSEGVEIGALDRSEARYAPAGRRGVRIPVHGFEATPGLSLRDASGLALAFRDGVPLPDPAAGPGVMALKRAMDVVLSLLALVMLLPVLLLIAAAIKATSPGPVLFRQRREGLGGRPIHIHKFRTMYLDRCDAAGGAQAVADDPRITPVGRILRRASLDELPQLFNVLRGDMALVGPRPHPFGLAAAGRPYEALVPYYRRRLTVKPGLSGWAQANGYRGPTGNAALARARIDHDLAYIAHFSLWLDIRIIALTLFREMIGGSGG